MQVKYTLLLASSPFFFHLHTSLTMLPNCSLDETGEFTVEFMEMHERGLCSLSGTPALVKVLKYAG